MKVKQKLLTKIFLARNLRFRFFRERYFGTIFSDDVFWWFKFMIWGWKWSGDFSKILICPNFDPMGVSRARKFKMENLKIDFRPKISSRKRWKGLLNCKKTYHLVESVLQLSLFWIFATFLQQMITVFCQQFWGFTACICLACNWNVKEILETIFFMKYEKEQNLRKIIANIPELLLINFPQALSNEATKPESLLKAVITRLLYLRCTPNIVLT